MGANEGREDDENGEKLHGFAGCAGLVFRLVVRCGLVYKNDEDEGQCGKGRVLYAWTERVKG